MTPETWTRSNAMRLVTAFVVAVLVAVSAATSARSVSAASRPVAVVHGIELIAEHTQGTFSGYATGGLPGGWLAVVDHTPLHPGARITGGTFTLITKRNGLAHPLAGRFTGGTITMTSPGAHCTNQTFKVRGGLAHFSGDGTGVFSVTLTHWRHLVLGTCLSYFATTDGTLTISS